MSQSQVDTSGPDLSEALASLESALAILDQLEIPAEIGAYVDLAISRLRERLQHVNTSGPNLQQTAR
jgi:hypothetical protein